MKNRNRDILLSVALATLLGILIAILTYRHKDELAPKFSNTDIADLLLTVPIVIITSTILFSIFPRLAKYVEEGNTKQKLKNDHNSRSFYSEKSSKLLNPQEKLNEVITSEEEKKVWLIEEHTYNLQNGISLQIDKISRSGTINLLIGLALTVLAIALLIGIVFSEEPAYLFDETTNSGTKFFIHMIPRLSIVLFVEVFSFFFLNLYKRNSDEIKYFNNERTNIESKILALKTAILFGNQDSITKTIESLNKVERNFTIKKTDTTIEIERSKIEKNEHDNLLGKFLQLTKVFNNKAEH